MKARYPLEEIDLTYAMIDLVTFIRVIGRLRAHGRRKLWDGGE